MKINQKILSIPPYVSTSWKNVVSLHMTSQGIDDILVIELANGGQIEVPNLDKAIIEEIFLAHERFVEKDNTHSEEKIHENSSSLFSDLLEENSALINLPFQLGFEGNMGGLLQHNPEAANSPNLPIDMLEKISALSKSVGIENLDSLPKAEPHCNCMHCQIMRNIQGQKSLEHHEDDNEEVSDEDLKFREWDIKQRSEKLYVVSNPFNQDEHFNVHLADPIGCTCGLKNCEHIRAVLNS